MGRIHDINDAIDGISEVETKLNYLVMLVNDLLDDYDCRDLEEMRMKIFYELPRVQIFLNIISDYSYAAKMKSAKIVSALEKICDEIKAEEGFITSESKKDIA